jgi:O-antigen/teichoic acid export membrane protein
MTGVVVAESAPPSADVKSIPATGRGKRIVFSASAGVFQRLAQAASTLLIMPLLLKVLGPARFGVWGAAASLAWLAGIVDLGMGAALVTAVANATALHREDDARRYITGALLAGSGLAALILILATAAVLAGVPQAGGTYLIAIIGLALNIPLSGASSLWTALQKGYVSGFWELVQTLLTTVALVVATLVSTDVRVYVAIVYCGLVLANVGSLAHFLLRHPELRPRGVDHPRKAAQSVAGMGMMYFALGVVGGLSYLLDNVFALELLGPEASARMTVALRICLTALGILAVIAHPLWPAFAEAAARGDKRWIRRGLVRGSMLLVAVAVLGSMVLLAAGGPFLRWWMRADLGIGRNLLWAMAVWIVMLAVARVPLLLLNALSVVRFQVLVCLIATPTAIALKVFLSDRLGVAGILWATTVSLVFITVPAAGWRIGRWMKSVRQESQRLGCDSVG